MGIIAKLKQVADGNQKLKKFFHWMLMPDGQARPRLWLRLLLPFLHSLGRGSTIRSSARMDVFPAYKFILGKRSLIESYSVVNNAVGDVIIGENSLIGISSVVIGPVTMGNNVIMAQHVVISGINHGYERTDIAINYQPVSRNMVVLKDGSWIGANSIITAGVTVGINSVVAAGSVVTTSVPDYTVVAGAPARIIKQFNPLTNIWERPKTS